jgi:hypothetical protein
MGVISDYLVDKTASEAAAIKAEKIAEFINDPVLIGAVLPYTFSDKATGYKITIKSATYDGKKGVLVFTDLSAVTKTGKPIPLNLPYVIRNPPIYAPSATMKTVTGPDGKTAQFPVMVEDPIAALKIVLVRLVARSA